MTESPLVRSVAVLGLYGLLFVQKMYERYNFLQARKDAWYKLLDQRHPGAKFLESRVEAYTAHAERFRVSRRIPVNVLWQVMNVVIIIAAAIALGQMLLAPERSPV